MSNLILPRRQIWTSQPQGLVELNDADPLNEGVVACVVGDSLRSIGPKQVVSIVGNVTKGVGKSGRGLANSYQASNNYVKIARSASLGYTSEVTFECLIEVKAFQTVAFPYISGIMGQWQYESLNHQWGPVLRFNADANIANAAVPVFGFQQSGSERAVVGVACDTGTPLHLIGTYKSGSLDLYTNGRRFTNSGVTGNFDNGDLNFISLMSEYVNSNTEHNRCLNGTMFFARVYDRWLSPKEAAARFDNRFSVFKRPDSRIFVPVSAGGGTSTVTSDSTASYKLQGIVQASTSASYNIQSAIQSDSTASYAIRSSVQQNITPSYAIRAAIQQDTVPSYSIRGLVDQAIAASYAIRSAISNDVVAAYSILSATAVSSSISAGYNIRGSINQDIAASYPLRGSVTQDTSATYSILSASTVSSSVTAGYAIKGSVQSSIIAGYSVAQAVQAEITANYIIRSGVVSESQAAYIIRGLVQQSTTATYAIEGIGGGFSGSLSDTDVARIAAAVLSIIQANPLVVYGNWPTANQNANAVMNQLNNVTQDVNVVSINGQIVVGDGTRALPWRPA